MVDNLDKERTKGIAGLDEKKAKQLGLRIFSPKVIKEKFKVEFENLDDEETLIYVMCAICGMTCRKMAKFLKKSHHTIQAKLNGAVRKRGKG